MLLLKFGIDASTEADALSIYVNVHILLCGSIAFCAHAESGTLFFSQSRPWL